ncbi:P-loop containing nucleoside triphosphate hydrolase protein [Gigaspora margarita]|uniref:P-loop containing nucleoside triphosphate hydrolase protein n=2 Tax=Gigaspora margarita TaxID=4874 RepID=A0A8H4AKL3_GIGMA|nr:P-loop containing nucleoside triphosphate hydrolase protein [Gigaspora margarita]
MVNNSILENICGTDPWGPWEDYDLTNCFREVVIDAGILLLYSTASLCTLISAYLQLRRHKGPDYERLLNSQCNSNYGTIEQSGLIEDNETDLDVSDDNSDYSDETLVSNQEIPKNMIFDGTRLAISIIICLIFSLLAIIRWQDHNGNQHGNYWIVTPILEAIVWGYAITLASFNIVSQQRSILHIRGHLNVLYSIAFVSSIINIHSLYLKLGIDFNLEYYINLLILSFSLILVCILIFEPQDDVELLSKPNADGRYSSPEVKCSLYDKLLFSWVNPLISKGFRSTLDDKDVFELPGFAKAKNILKAFHSFQKSSIIKSLIFTFRKELLIQLIYSIIWSLMYSFVPPYYLQKLLSYVQDYPTPEDSYVTAYSYAFGLFWGTVIPSLCFQQALYIGRHLSVKSQAIIIGEVYLKALSRKDTSGIVDNEESKNKTGKITNLMAVDAQKISEFSAYIFYLYSYPIQIIISIWLLYSLLGLSALAGVLAIIITYPLQAYTNQMFQTIHKSLMAATDKRMGVINELLQAIRVIKFFAWEDQFRAKIMSARDNEIKEIKRRLMQWVYMICLWTSLPLIIMVAVFITYTKLFGNELTAAVAFTALALFNNLRHALDEMPSMLVYIIQAQVSNSRIEKFLKDPEIDRKCSIQNFNDPYIGFKSATFQWPDGEDSIDNSSVSVDLTMQTPLNKFTLKNLNVSFPVNELSIICGPTGSGKTSLLMALLGEMECVDGRVFLPRMTTESSNKLGGAPSGVAYVAQTAWLQNATIRDNILFGLPFDQETYAKVLRVCALDRDLEILEFGDQTEVGEKGITLSGGQKQRVALARAVYSQAKIIIIDDCLSAVDSHTAKHIYEQCLVGDLMKDRTRILVTHHVGLCLRGAAKVVVMKDGQISGEGTVEKILATGLLDGVTLESEEESETSVEDVTDAKSQKNKTIREGDGKLVAEETRAVGRVEWKYYKLYLVASGGFWYWMSLLLLFIVAQTIQVGQEWWIREWTKAYNDPYSQIHQFALTISGGITSFLQENLHNSMKNFALSSYVLSPTLNHSISTDHFSSVNIWEETHERVNVDYYLGVYVSIGLVCTILTSFKAYYMFMGSLVASRKLHNDMLDKILSATIRFYDTTPIGRILNRFSKDMETIDQNFSPVVMFLLYSCHATASVILVISIVMPRFLIAAVFISAIYIIIGAYYIATSRDLKRLESVSRSPIYAAFGETIIGVSTIRAFGAEKRLMKRMLSLVDNNNRPFIFNWACNRWLHTRVDIAGGLVGLSTAVIIVYNLSNGMDPGLAGFALLNALNFTGHVIWVLRMYAVQEMNMNSVERVHDYLVLEEEPPRIVEGHRPPPEWPTKGDIQVKNLVMQYAPDNPPVLKDISFHIKPAEKVGIVGRTGSGKSTLATSFFRFMEPTSGQIFIDDIDISTIGLFDLRSKLTIIPQDPVLFSGTLRSNLDSFNEYDDAELWNALRRAHLIDDTTISSDTDNDNKSSQSEQSQAWTLDAPVSENGNNYSQGQRQLIALARALVRKSKLIIMDEATASVDFKTDRMIQKTIREEFSDATLLCIAHRLRTVVDYDKILVLDAGKIVEFDHPYILLQNPASVFRGMCDRSGDFAELVEVAKAKYEKNYSNISV